MGMRDDLTDVPGFRVGSAEDLEACTGCTVVLCPPDGAVGGVEQRGGAPGTRETDPLRPLHLVDRCHAVLLAGGSAFGLDAAGGVARYLERHGIGFPTRAARVPIVPAAVIYDLAVGRPDVRPDAAMGEVACLEAERGGKIRQGNAGAGCGATVGKVHGLECAMKGGLGSASSEVVPGIIVGALTIVNAFGDIIDPAGGRILAGARLPGSKPNTPAFADTISVLRALGGRPLAFAPPTNTVLAVVATNTRLDKEGANILAGMATAGLSRAIRPVHTMVDGDTVFALSFGERACDVSLLGAVAAETMTRAIVNAVLRAKALEGLPCASEIRLPEGGLRIRGGGPADADAVVAVARDLPEWFVPKAEIEVRGDMARYGSLIAEIEGRAVGFLIHGPSALHPEPRLLQVHWMGVARSHRGCGVGQALMRCLEEICRAQGGGTIELWTVAETEYYPPYADTRAFYHACGYEDFYTDATARDRIGCEILTLRKRIAGT